MNGRAGGGKRGMNKRRVKWKGDDTENKRIESLKKRLKKEKKKRGKKEKRKKEKRNT